MLFIREIVFTRAVHLFIYHNNGLYKRIPIFLSNNGRYKRKSIYLIIYLTRNSFYLTKVVTRVNLFILRWSLQHQTFYLSEQMSLQARIYLCSCNVKGQICLSSHPFILCAQIYLSITPFFLDF